LITGADGSGDINYRQMVMQAIGGHMGAAEAFERILAFCR
jgi:hypothetical protein